MTQLDRAKREQLLESGHCLFADVLDQTMLERLRRATDRQLDTQTEEQKGRFRSQGSMFGFDQTPDPVFAELIAWPRALEALAALGSRTSPSRTPT